MKQKTYIMLKPGFTDANLEKDIISRISAIGGKILDRKSFKLSPKILKVHYSHLLDLVDGNGKRIYPNIERYMTSGIVVAFIVEGENIIENVRKILGPTKNAPKGTIRGDYARGITENVMHASDSEESAKAEIERFFGKNCNCEFCICEKN